MPKLSLFGTYSLLTLEDKTLRSATIAQIEKDFALQAIAIKIPAWEGDSHHFLTSFSTQLDTINLVHHPRFISLLYQLDLPENTIAETLRRTPPDKIYTVLAEAIALQCFRKVRWRQQMK